MARADEAQEGWTISTSDRTVIVYLPPSYRTAPRRRYPVLYLHDGNNVFDRATAFLGREWQLDETVQSLVGEGKLREIIMVGVYNTPDRIFEYTWVPRQEGGAAQGGGGVGLGIFSVRREKVIAMQQKANDIQSRFALS